MILKKGIGYNESLKYELCTPYFFHKIKLLDEDDLINKYSNEDMIFHFYKNNPLNGLIITSKFNFEKHIDDYINSLPPKLNKNKIIKIFGNYIEHSNFNSIQKIYQYIKKNRYKYDIYDSNMKLEKLNNPILSIDVNIFKKICILIFEDTECFSIEWKNYFRTNIYSIAIKYDKIEIFNFFNDFPVITSIEILEEIFSIGKYQFLKIILKNFYEKFKKSILEETYNMNFFIENNILCIHYTFDPKICLIKLIFLVKNYSKDLKIFFENENLTSVIFC